MIISILIVLFIFLIIGISGLIILRTITNELNILMLMPSSIFLGLCVYIFLININSRILHGPPGLFLSTIEFILLSSSLYFKYRNKWQKINFETFSQTKFLIFSILILITARVITTSPAADSTIQWAYAGIFARGNYPLMMPWQANLSSTYHLGIYFFEGTLQYFSGLSFSAIHSLVNIYLIVPAILMSTFLLWQTKNLLKNIWLILASLVLFISFGVIVLIYPSFSSIPKIIVNLNQIVSAIPAKGEAGAPLVSLHMLTYLPARSFGLGIIFLALYFTRIPFKNKLFRIISYSLIFSVLALSEESMFLPLFLVPVSLLFLSALSFIPNLAFLKQNRRDISIFILITIIIIVLQGGFITDNLFTVKETSYRLNFPFLSQAFQNSAMILRNVNITSISSWQYINWFIPSPLWIIFALLLYSFLKKEPVTGLLGIFSLICFLLSLTVEYIYFPASSSRFSSLGNLTAGYGLMLLFFLLLNKLSPKKNLLMLLAVTPILLIPTLLPDLVKQIELTKQGFREHKANSIFSISSDPQEIFTKWANRNLPLNTQIIVLERQFPAPTGSMNFEYQGLYTLLGPQNTRVLRQEPGPLYFDLALTLNPSLFKQTNTGYIYIESESLAFQQLPQFRKDDLSNGKYFKVLLDRTQDDEKFFRLYKVLPLFIDPKTGGKEISDVTLQKLTGLLPNDKSIYINDYNDEKFSFWYRMALVLSLKDKDTRRELSQTDYMAIETFLPRKSAKSDEVYDFYILPPKEKPPVDAKLIWSNIFASAWKSI